jgi:hypothetical protein
MPWITMVPQATKGLIPLPKVTLIPRTQRMPWKEKFADFKDAPARIPSTGLEKRQGIKGSLTA